MFRPGLDFGCESAFCLCLFNNSRKAVFGYGAYYFGANLHGYKAVFLSQVKAFYLQVGVKLALGLVVSVRNAVTHLRSLSGYLTNTCHYCSLFLISTVVPNRSAKIEHCVSNTKLSND